MSSSGLLSRRFDPRGVDNGARPDELAPSLPSGDDCGGRPLTRPPELVLPVGQRPHPMNGMQR